MEVNVQGRAIVNVAGVVYGDVGCNKGLVMKNTGIKSSDLLDMLIENTTGVFHECDIYRIARETLQDHGHVTLIGAAGEGKTSTALMIGVEYKEKGYELLFVDSIHEFDLSVCIGSDRKVCLIMDDIFGSVGLSSDVPHLRKIVNDLDICMTNQKRKRDKRQGHQHLYVIFTSKSYNLEYAKSKLEGAGFYFFHGPAVLDLTKSFPYTSDERREIFRNHQRKNEIIASIDIEMACNIRQTIFGFPLTCKLFFEVSVAQDDFFEKPLTYLQIEIDSILQRGGDQAAALILMLMVGKELNLSEIQTEGKSKKIDAFLEAIQKEVRISKRADVASAVKYLRGTFFTEGDIVMFSHSIIYDACACSVFKLNETFLLKYCSMNFLFERVQPQLVVESSLDDDLHIIYVSEVHNDIIASKIADAIDDGIYSLSITHPILQNEAIVDAVFEKLKLRPISKLEYVCRTKAARRMEILHTEDTDEGKHILNWAIQAGSLYLVKKVMEFGYQFTLTEVNGAFQAAVSCNIPSVVSYFLSEHRSWLDKTTIEDACLKVAENGFNEILKYLIFSGLEFLNARNKHDENIFEIAKRTGNTTSGKEIISRIDDLLGIPDSTKNRELDFLLVSNKGLITSCKQRRILIASFFLPTADVNSQDPEGRTPIMIAAYLGDANMFDLLMSSSPDHTLIDTFGNVVFHFACQGGNSDIVECLSQSFDKNIRGQNGCTPVLLAASRGQKKVFEFLVEEGADLSIFDQSNNSVLHHASQGGNIDIMKRILKSLPPNHVNSPGKLGLTPVMLSAINGEENAFDLLVSEGASLELTDDQGNTLLHHACQGGNIEIVKRVTEAFDINGRGHEGLTPIMLAAARGNFTVFDFLIRKGADITSCDIYKRTLLHFACLGGNIKIAAKEQLLCYINNRGKDGLTPILDAARLGRQDIFNFLETKGADLTVTDNNNDNAFHHACRSGNIDLVKHLQPSFDVNIRGHKGMTPIAVVAVNSFKDVFIFNTSNLLPLHSISKRGSPCDRYYTPPKFMNSVATTTSVSVDNGYAITLFDFLCSIGADISVVNDGLDTLLHLACKEGNRSIVEYLLPMFDINVRSQNNSTPIMAAVCEGQTEVFDLLVSEEADLTLKNNNNYNLLHLACFNGNVRIAEYLLPKFDINSLTSSSLTPVMVAALYGRKEVFDLLVARDADLKLIDKNRNTTLHLACKGGNRSIVEYLLPMFDINVRSQNNSTPIMIAVCEGQTEVFDLLVSEEADLTLKNNDNDNLLHLACINGNVRIAEYLLPKFDINSLTSSSRTPVMVAALYGRKEVFDLLVARDADLKLIDKNRNTTLHMACKGGNRSIVEYLLPMFDINVRSQNNSTPIMIAVCEGQTEVFDLLVSEEADLTLKNNDNDNLLHLACINGNVRIAEYLLPKFDINSLTSSSLTPVMVAALYGRKEVFDLLVARDADLKLIDKNRNTTLHMACKGGNRSIVEYLLPMFDINVRSQNNSTPIMIAVCEGQTEVFDLLVSEEADLTLKNNDNDNLLHLACFNGNVRIAVYLLPKFDINSLTSSSWTPVMVAALYGRKEVFDLLVARDADLKLIDKNRETILHMACKGGNRSIVEYLLPMFDINVRSQNNSTPIMIAVCEGQTEVFDLLVSEEADLTLKNNDNDNLLHMACINGNVRIAEYLLPKFDINSLTSSSLTPVMVAALYGKKEVFDLLVARDADLKLIDKDRETILHLACGGGNRSIVEYLLPMFDINVRSQDNSTPIMAAVCEGQTEVFDLLVSEEADLTLKNNNNYNLLHLACINGNLRIAEYLLPKFDINSLTSSSRTPVMIAALYGRKEVFDLLVARDADLKLIDKNRNTILHMACKGGNRSIVEYLLPMFDINVRSQNNSTPIMTAVCEGQTEVFDLLVSEEADLTLKNNNNYNLLHLACINGNVRIAEYLLPKFDINSLTSSSRTPVMVAALYGRKEVFDLLVARDADLKLIDKNRNTTLHLACKGGNRSIVEYLLPMFDIN